MLDRSALLARLDDAADPFDLVVVGGGATGAGVALDAAHRGLSVALVERGDFGSGTSSRSSKLVHGGVRYLALAQFGLVREALAERACLLANASAMVERLPFLVPAGGRLELAKFAVGLRLYDWLAGRAGIGRSRVVDRAEAEMLAPGLDTRSLAGAVRYLDAQFDDARLVIAILKRAVERGAIVLNHTEVEALLKDGGGRVCGVAVRDRASGRAREIAARCVVNATGPYGDALRRMDGEAGPPAVAPSQGAHLVVDARFLGGDHALVLPETRDGRIMFAIPWAGRLLLGTTDTAVRDVPETPVPQAREVEEILDHSRRFLDPAPALADVRSAFAGVRPLAATPSASGTAKISREHVVSASPSGLVSVSGGKWTTYRRMAEDCVNLVSRTHGLALGEGSTRDLVLARGEADPCFALDEDERPIFGSLLAERADLDAPVHPDLPYLGAHFAWAARHEMALGVADALRYRTRAAFLDAGAALSAVPVVASIMAAELAQDDAWIAEQIREASAALAAFRPAGAAAAAPTLTPIRARETPG